MPLGGRVFVTGEASMPVPTDTLWNIKRLNKVFAASSIILLGVIGWTILQDYDKGWREPQRQGKVWEAALVDEKITRELTPEVQKQANEIDAQIHELLAVVREKVAGFFKQLRMDVSAIYLSDAGVWERIGFPGPSSESGGYPDFDQRQTTTHGRGAHAT